jgi:hypothetical protein
MKPLPRNRFRAEHIVIVVLVHTDVAVPSEQHGTASERHPERQKKLTDTFGIGA